MGGCRVTETSTVGMIINWPKMREAVMKCKVDNQLEDFPFLPRLLLVMASFNGSIGTLTQQFYGFNSS